MKGPTKSLLKGESSKKAHESIDESLRDYGDKITDDQSSPTPRGVLEFSGSSSDSDNSSMLFCEKSPAMETGSNPSTEIVPWRILIDSFKWKSKSPRRFSTLKNNFMEKMGRNHGSEATINEFYVPKPSWRNFSFQQLSAATNGFSLGSTKSLLKGESSKQAHENIDESLKEYGDKITDDQSSPRGVLEVSGSGSDSDNSSMLFCEKSPATATGSNPSTELVPWRNLIDSFKWKSKSLRRFSTSKNNFMKKMGRNHSSEATINEFYVPKPSWRNFSFQQLSAATNGFSLDNLVGKGGHAEVYRGCLPDGQVVAVKKITKKQKKDEDRAGDFLTELGIIAHINHPNAAKLIGFSSDTDLHLVLQFAPHGSLATLLHNSEENLEWKIRFKIAIGIAEGLQYLHYECNKRIIHRDITASNILLTEDYEPQISDFGLAKWLPGKWIHQVVSPIEGTFGYMAPEYFMHGVIHEKTDVFAFGVLLLELITGRRAVDSHQQSLVIWAKPLLEEGNVEELVDPRLGNEYEVMEVNRTIVVASSCIHHMPELRPSMKRVVQILKGECSSTVELRQNTFDGRSIILDACDLEGYTSTTYLKDLTRHRQLVMEY